MRKRQKAQNGIWTENDNDPVLQIKFFCTRQSYQIYHRFIFRVWSLTARAIWSLEDFLPRQTVSEVIFTFLIL
jgi:hypothetical protein